MMIFLLILGCWHIGALLYALGVGLLVLRNDGRYATADDRRTFWLLKLHLLEPLCSVPLAFLIAWGIGGVLAGAERAPLGVPLLVSLPMLLLLLPLGWLRAAPPHAMLRRCLLVFGIARYCVVLLLFCAILPFGRSNVPHLFAFATVWLLLALIGPLLLVVAARWCWRVHRGFAARAGGEAAGHGAAATGAL